MVESQHRRQNATQMAVNLKNAEAERLLNELAERTGESLTEAASRAFAERLARLKREQEANRRRQLRVVQDLIDEARAAKDTGEPTKAITDELWGE